MHAGSAMLNVWTYRLLRWSLGGIFAWKARNTRLKKMNNRVGQRQGRPVAIIAFPELINADG
jgi:hypothetical protein